MVLDNYLVFYFSLQKLELIYKNDSSLIMRILSCREENPIFTLSLASRSCFTTTISARSSTLVMAARSRLAGRMRMVRSANKSSSVSSHICSISPPVNRMFLNTTLSQLGDRFQIDIKNKFFYLKKPDLEIGQIQNHHQIPC